MRVTVDTKGALAVMRRLLPRQARTLTALRGFAARGRDAALYAAAARNLPATPGDAPAPARPV